MKGVRPVKYLWGALFAVAMIFLVCGIYYFSQL